MNRNPADRTLHLRVRSAGFLLPALLLVACGSGSGTGPGGVSEGEAAALDEAAEALDKQQIPEGVLPSVNSPSGAPASGGRDNGAAPARPAE